ncbi:PAS domain S-box protein [Okeania sp. SIO3B5]|uniref:PAS domain S-box protein n=1 Tax=Okeania sp. SIO3B5 TaxID=2607811 RepID=UPI0025EE38F9|nr:PAS domain S-box protein [Okeania sp. SIO3B5]
MGIFKTIQQAVTYEKFQAELQKRKKVEARLQESEQRYFTLVKVSNEGIWATDTQDRISFVNLKMAEMLGYEIDEILGKSLFDFMDSAGIAIARKNIEHRHQGIAEQREFKFQHKDGSDVWAKVSGNRILDELGNYVGGLGTFADISIRKQTEFSLQQSEQRYASLAMAAPVGIFRSDATGHFTYINERYSLISGLSQEMAMKDGWRQIIHPEELDWVVAEWQKFVLESSQFQLECRLLQPDGTINWVYAQAVAERNADGIVVGYVGTITDISARKQAEIALKQSEQRFRKLFESTPKIAVQGYDRHRQVIYWNNASEDLYGYTKAEAIGQKLEDLIIPSEEREREIDFTDDFFAKGEPVLAGEFNLRCKDASRVTVFSNHMIMTNSEGEPEMYCVDIDISGRKKAEIALQTLVEGTASTTGKDFFPALVRHIVEALNVSCAIVSELVGDMLRPLAFWANGSLQQSISYHPAKTPCERTLRDGKYFCEYSVQQEFPEDLDLINIGAESYLGIALRDSNGKTIGGLCILNQQLIPDPERAEQILRVFASRASVELERQRATTLLEELNQKLETKVKERTVKLQERETRYRALMDGASDAILLADRQGNLLEANHKFEELLGYTSTEITSMHFTQLHPPEELSQSIAAFEDVANQKSSQILDINFLRKDGSIVPVDISASLIDINGEKIIQNILRDISERKAAERALMMTQSAVDFAAEGVFFVRSDASFYYVNQAACSMLGYSIEELLNLSMFDINYDISPDDWIEHWQNIRQRKNFTNESRYQAKDGSVYPVEVSINYLQFHTEEYSFAFVKDISERKQAENDLRQSQEFLQTVLNVLPLYVFWKDRQLMYLGCNQNFAEIVGLSSSEAIIGKTDYDIPWKNTQATAYRADDLEVMESGLAKHEIIESQLQADGNQKCLETHKVPLYSLDGEIIGVLGVYQDITTRKQAESALKQQLAAIEAAIDGIAILQGNSYLYVNQAHVNLFGYQNMAEIVGQPWQIFYSPEENQRFEQEIFPLLERDRAWQGEATGTRKDGSTFAEGLSLTLTEDGLLICVCRDITERKQAEEKLFKSEAALVEAQRVAHIGNWEFDVKTQKITWSKELFRMFGLSPNQPEPSYAEYFQMIHPDDLTLVQQQFESAIVNGIPYKIDYRIVYPDGSTHYHEGRTAIERNSEGKVIRLFGTALDITERKQAEDHLRELSTRLNLAVESAGIGIWDFDIVKNILLWDKRMYELYGITPDGFTNVREAWLKTLHPDDRPMVETASMQARFDEKEYNTEFRAIHPDGSIHFIKTSALVQRNLQGEAQRMIGINYDITEQKKAEAELKQTNEELARATRLKDEFLASMSHELRTPLNAILGMSEALQEEVFGAVDEQQLKALQTIEHSGAHLLELINDILDVAKIEAGRIELNYTQVSIYHLCQSSITFVKQLALKKRIHLKTKLPTNLPIILIDERRIRQALINLLNNAVKFTQNGGSVTLTATLKQGPLNPGVANFPKQNYIQIAVIDTGIGITPENLKKLFQPFIQIDSALNREYNGTGLGLTLVKRIVELHGGQVGVKSEIGVGSCFTMDIPYAATVPYYVESETNSEVTIKPSQLDGDISPPLILLAEDNDANITTVLSYLRAKNYRLIVAKTGEEAIALVQSEDPDLILMDIQMPGMDGLEAIKHIRHDLNLVDIPIVAMTALAMEGDREHCLAAGANDYLSKPVKMKKLANTIQELLTFKEDK